MAQTDIDSAAVGDLQNAETLFEVDSLQLDGATDQKETRYQNHNWGEQLGTYKSIPEVKAAIDAKVRWTIGKGYKSNELTELKLSTIKGFGKDSFNTILENMTRVVEIGGDSFAEIIDDKNGTLSNLKPLDPGTMITVANRKGLIIRYEQATRVKGAKNKTFLPGEIFHLSRDRVGDEIHGVSVIDSVKETILARNEAIRDYRVLLRRNVKPVKVWEIDSDDTAEIAAFQTKVDNAFIESENLVVPKGSVLPPTIVGVPPNSTLNPLPWINQLTQNFYKEVGVPQIIVGGAEEITGESAKIAYLAWEQTIEEKQLYLEEQVLSQLNMEIDLEFPASLQNELLSDNRKDVENGVTSQEDTEVTNVGVSNAT